jgi:hypothetical protein
MSETTSRTIPWLPIAGGGALLVGAVVLVLGITSASGAASDREEAESAAADQQSAVAAARRDLSDAVTALENAQAEGSQARADLQTAEATLEDTGATLAAVDSALEGLLDQIPAFVISASDLTAGAAAVVPGIEDLVAQRRSQVEAILAGDYREFNDLRSAYLEPAGTVAQELDDLATQFEGLPAVPLSEPYEYLGSSLEGSVPDEPQELDPPTGPAVITVELPGEIPCDPWGDGGCRYSWIAQFVESNWLDVTIDRIGIRYRRGSGYCTIGVAGESASEREWDDVNITVSANGTDSTSGSLVIDPSDECWPVRGGELLLRWEGTDGEGNRLSGRATAPLENPG